MHILSSVTAAVAILSFANAAPAVITSKSNTSKVTTTSTKNTSTTTSKPIITTSTTSTTSTTTTTTTPVTTATPTPTMKLGTFSQNFENGVSDPFSSINTKNDPAMSSKIVTDAPNAHSGSRYAAINVGDSLGNYWSYLTPYLELADNTNYTVSAWAKASPATAGCYMHYQGTMSSNLAFNKHYPLGATYTNPVWTFNTASSGDDVYFGIAFTCSSPATIYFDDAALL